MNSASKKRGISHGRKGLQGIAALEAAACLLVFLPLALYSVELAGWAFDQSVVEGLTYRMLREAKTVPLELSQGSLAPRTAHLERVASEIAQVLHARALEQLLFSRELGGVACFEVHRVDTRLGRSLGIASGRCSTFGSSRPDEAQISASETRVQTLDHHVSGVEAERVIGIPTIHGAMGDRYLGIAVLYRLALWARGPGFGLNSNIVWSHRIIIPRQEVQL
jgi:hypothetical protein